jgi:type I restriction enzyme S subunit
LSQITPITTKVPQQPHLPRTWRWAPLTTVARLESGHTPSRKSPEYWGGDVPWLSLKDMQRIEGRYIFDTVDKPTMLGIENSSARLLPAGTVALCRTASVGKVAILGREMATSQDFVDWVCGPQLDPEYLYWALSCSGAAFDVEKQGSTHKTIYMPTLERLNVLLPPLDEQRRIAAILDKADAIRRKRQEAIALTEQLLRSTFLEMFGDPVTNPKGWPWAVMNDIIRETQYGTSAKANQEGRGLPVLRMNNLTNTGGLDLSDIKWCEIDPKDLAAYTVKRGDVLFNRTNSPELVGKTAVWTLDEAYAFAGYLVRVRFDESRVLPHYVSGFLNSDYGKRMLFAMQKTSNNMSNISATDLRRIRLPLPTIEQQRRYHSFVEAIVSTSPRRRDALAQADQLFNSLTQRAFSGQL